jgi:hypothetical protein
MPWWWSEFTLNFSLWTNDANTLSFTTCTSWARKLRSEISCRSCRIRPRRHRPRIINLMRPHIILKHNNNSNNNNNNRHQKRVVNVFRQIKPHTKL